MRFIEVEVPEKTAYIIPVGDIHFGDEAFKQEGRTKLLGYLDWVKANPNARIWLNGDIFNVASRQSKTNPLESTKDEYMQAIEFFRPYAKQIIGAVDGNHESRVYEMFGFSPLMYFCMALDIPYCKFSAIIRLKVGKRPNGHWRQIYNLYAHHTTGGGGTIGGKINRVIKLRDICEGIDVYLGSHNHQLAVAPQDVYVPSFSAKGFEKRRIWYVDCGSFLEWNDSYAEKGMMAPTKLGSPRIRFGGIDGHDVHISL